MPDYMYMLESRLSAEQRAVTLRMMELSAEIGLNVYLTGGAVRDLISGMFIRDLDFTVEGNPQRLVRELEKGGARLVDENESLRHYEMIFSGDVDGSVSAARDEVYARPGTRVEIRWSTIMEDLLRRDFSINAIAISLNPASRGLLLDPTNGLADLEKHEVRALSIHSFTNRPVRVLRLLRYCARLDFKPEVRTGEWFDLALERGLQATIPPEDAGLELRQLAREGKPIAVLKAWEARGLIAAIHPQLARRHANYEMLARIVHARDDLAAAGLRPRLLVPVTYAVLGRLKPQERASVLHRLGYPASEVSAVMRYEAEARKVAKVLASNKMKEPADAFSFLEKLPGELTVFLSVASSNATAVGRLRSYLHKWRPLRQALPATRLELEMLGLEHGPKFEKVIEDFFRSQLAGKGRTPEDRIRLLRKLSGIKEPAKVKSKEEKKKKPVEKLKKKLLGKGGSTPTPAELAVGAKAEVAEGKTKRGKGTDAAAQEVVQGASAGGSRAASAAHNKSAAISKSGKRERKTKRSQR
jgi:tRNA nucleotidyltransferase (CCA-adding enzyme)